MAGSRIGLRALAAVGAFALLVQGPALGYAPDDTITHRWQDILGRLKADPEGPLSGTAVPGHGFRGCAETAYEVFDYILNLGLGVPPEKAEALAPSPGSAAALRALIEEEGLERAYLMGHALYLRCTADTETRMRTAPAWSGREDEPYAACGRRNAARLLVLTIVQERGSEADVLAQLPQASRDAGAELYGVAKRDGLLKALLISGEAHRTCVDAIRNR